MESQNKEKNILLFGDSNIWGYIPGSQDERFSTEKRVGGILQKNLGGDFHIIEEGLCGRTINLNHHSPDKNKGRNGLKYIIPCLDSHEPLDLIVIMLGSNDMKSKYNNNSRDIRRSMRKLLSNVLKRNTLFFYYCKKIILIAPPKINEDAQKISESFIGAQVKSEELVAEYKELAQKFEIDFLSAFNCKTGIDGIHLTQDGHNKLAKIIQNKIVQVLK